MIQAQTDPLEAQME